MTHHKSPTRRDPRNSMPCRAVLIALALLPAGCNRDEQQAGKAPAAQRPAAQSGQPTSAPATPAPAAPQAPTPVPQAPPVQPPAAPAPPPAAKPLTDLESLVAPIALYPDPLLAELLVASTYPLEVVQAARWLETKPDLATLNTKDWDASVMRLASVPQVIKMMNDHLDWTTQLGDAFLAKPAELMDAIQTLRKRATDSGFLKDTPEQKVTAKTVSAAQPPEEAAPTTEAAGEETVAPTVKATPAVLKQEVITIEPAKSDTVYVPQYNPETVYQAPLAPPPATGSAYPATTAGYTYPAAAPAPSYYPTYYPAPATTTTSTTDSWMTFGAGAVVGGLLTWGIMEWADDDDDWDDDYHVMHHYGDSVCHEGNCWSGGGGYGGRGDVNVDRGDITRNRNVNISGNEINVERGGTFSQSNLRPVQQPAGWQPNPRHRRGQAYPEAAQKRLGRTEQPALAGQRLSAAQTLPATARGFGEAGARPSAGALPAGRRPSSAEIQQRLAQKPATQERLGAKQAQPRPAARDVQARLGQGTRNNALEGIREPARATQMESRRGAESRRQTAPAAREPRAREAAGGQRLQRRQAEQPRQVPVESRPKMAERRAEPSQRPQQRPSFAGRERAPQMQTQRRSESARPNAFEGGRDARATQNFSQRGAASRQQMSAARPQRDFGGGRAGGGGARGGGGGRRR
jgi:hypothetical protein